MTDPRAPEPPADEMPAEGAPADETGVEEPAADEQTTDEQTTPRATQTDWERRRRLAAVFGDVLPETTRDEREPGSEDGSEEWLRRQVPPHHG